MEKYLDRSKVGQFRILKQAQLKAIHSASLQVLRTTGYRAPVTEARGIGVNGWWKSIRRDGLYYT